MSLLLRVLRHADEARHLSPLDWDLLVRQCRHANLLGRLHQRLEAAGVAMPERARNHLLSGTIMAEQQHHSILREVLPGRREDAEQQQLCAVEVDHFEAPAGPVQVLADVRDAAEAFDHQAGDGVVLVVVGQRRHGGAEHRSQCRPDRP